MGKLHKEPQGKSIIWKFWKHSSPLNIIFDRKHKDISKKDFLFSIRQKFTAPRKGRIDLYERTKTKKRCKSNSLRIRLKGKMKLK